MSASITGASSGRSVPAIGTPYVKDLPLAGSTRIPLNQVYLSRLYQSMFHHYFLQYKTVVAEQHRQQEVPEYLFLLLHPGFKAFWPPRMRLGFLQVSMPSESKMTDLGPSPVKSPATSCRLLPIRVQPFAWIASTDVLLQRHYFAFGRI